MPMVLMSHSKSGSIFFFFNDTATTEIYTLSLHDALPIYIHHHPLGGREVERLGQGLLISGAHLFLISCYRFLGPGDAWPEASPALPGLVGRFLGLGATARQVGFGLGALFAGDANDFHGQWPPASGLRARSVPLDVRIGCCCRQHAVQT